jgi:hypothetical protein
MPKKLIVFIHAINLNNTFLLAKGGTFRMDQNLKDKPHPPPP